MGKYEKRLEDANEELEKQLEAANKDREYIKEQLEDALKRIDINLTTIYGLNENLVTARENVGWLVKRNGQLERRNEHLKKQLKAAKGKSPPK